MPELTPAQRARDERNRLKTEATMRRIEAEEDARAQEAAECDAWRARMRPLLDAYTKTLNDSTDLGELRVWATGELAVVEETSSMKLLQTAWSELRLAFGHDSKTITKRIIGSDFEPRLMKALEDFALLEKSRLEAPPTPVTVVDVTPPKRQLAQGGGDA